MATPVQRLAQRWLNATSATEAQVSYALHLVKQQGLTTPTEEQIREMDRVQISMLIDGLKKKRGTPYWYGNGQFGGFR